MKRTLLEVACGLAALVVLVSFNNRISALKGQDDEVRDLRTQVGATLAKAGSKQELSELRAQLLAQLDARMHEVDGKLQNAAAGSADAEKLKSELTKAEREVARLRDELQTDNSRTKAMVDAYMDEVRAKENTANLKLVEARAAISTIAGQLVKARSEE